jgi:hypothetical protein
MHFSRHGGSEAHKGSDEIQDSEKTEGIMRTVKTPEEVLFEDKLRKYRECRLSRE